MSSSDNPRLRLTESELCAWIGRSLPGDILECHRGFLAVDLATVPDRKPLKRLARRAAWASDAGLVHLVQKRRGPGAFSYLAIRRPRPRAARRRHRETDVAPEPELEDAT